MGKTALVKADSRAPGYVRSAWSSYQEAKWGWHVVVPLGLAGTAGMVLTWAWTMLDQHEYGAAMLLTLLFLVVGVGAALAVTSRILRIIAVVVVIMVVAFSGLKIWQERGDQPWTTLGHSKKKQTAPPTPPISGAMTEPTFTDEVKDVVIIMGGNSF